MAAVFALVGKVLGNLRLLGKEPICDTIRRYLGERTFCVTILAAQNPLRVGGHRCIVRADLLHQNTGKYGFPAKTLPYYEYAPAPLIERLSTVEYKVATYGFN